MLSVRRPFGQRVRLHGGFPPPPYPPLRPGPLRRRFAKNTVFLEDFGPKRLKRLRRGVPGGPRGGVLGGPFGSIWVPLEENPLFLLPLALFSGVLGPTRGSVLGAKSTARVPFSSRKWARRPVLCSFWQLSPWLPAPGRFSSGKWVPTPAPCSLGCFSRSIAPCSQFWSFLACRFPAPRRQRGLLRVLEGSRGLPSSSLAPSPHHPPWTPLPAPIRFA